MGGKRNSDPISRMSKLGAEADMPRGLLLSGSNRPHLSGATRITVTPNPLYFELLIFVFIAQFPYYLALDCRATIIKFRTHDAARLSFTM